MIDTTLKLRPRLSEIDTFEDFDNWYWPVSEMQSFCRENGLAYSGLKAELRNRLGCHFQGAPLPKEAKTTKRSSWAKKELYPETEIDENISFGWNVRGFFIREVGPQFVCSGEFMTWVKSNTGRTLGDAVKYWVELNERASSPGFRREIDRCNNYLQYLRDIRDKNPKLSQEEAKRCWTIKSRLPALKGYVECEATDVELLARIHLFER